MCRISYIVKSQWDSREEPRFYCKVPIYIENNLLENMSTKRRSEGPTFIQTCKMMDKPIKYNLQRLAPRKHTSVSHLVNTAAGASEDTENQRGKLRLQNLLDAFCNHAFRLYINSLGDKAVYRGEESVKMNSSIVDALDTIIRTIPSQDYTKYTRDDELVDAR